MRSPTAGESVEKRSYTWSSRLTTTSKGHEDEEPAEKISKQSVKRGQQENTIHRPSNVLKLMSDLSIEPATD